MTKTLPEIATMAVQLGRKTNKREAFQLITEAIEAGEPLTDGAMAALYGFFMPSPVPAKKPFDWVGLAISTEETRYYLCHVYVTDGRMVATNGHLLHLLPTDREDGFYDKAGVKIEVDATFPDFDRVIPPAKGKTFVWKRKAAELVKPWTDGHTGKLVHSYKLPNGTYVNKAYWDKATAGLDSVEFQNADSFAPIRIFFDDDSKIAVVMPIRGPRK